MGSGGLPPGGRSAPPGQQGQGPVTKERGRRPAGGSGGSPPRASTTFAVAAGAALTAYNNVFGLHPWHSRWYVRLNAGATGAALAAAALGGLTATDLGLGRGRWLPGRLGSGLAAGAAASWLVIAAVPATRPLLDDNRVAGLDRRAVAYQALIRIPVGTALWEETAFRGVLQAALRRVMPGAAAILVTSGLFGAWHIRPTVQALRVNGLAEDRRRALTGTLAGVAGTAAGGVLLSWLRERTGRLAAPVLLHAAVNSGALIAAVLVRESEPRMRRAPLTASGSLAICSASTPRQYATSGRPSMATPCWATAGARPKRSPTWETPTRRWAARPRPPPPGGKR
jgi:uncharacterized protein